MKSQPEIIEWNQLLLQSLRGGLELRFGRTVLQTRLCHYTLDDAGFDTREHRHPHYELSVLLSGEMFDCGAGPSALAVTLECGEWILIAPGLPHRRAARCDNSLLLGFALNIQHPSPALHRLLRNRLRKIDGSAVKNQLERLAQQFRELQPFRIQRLRLLLAEILLELFADNFSAQRQEQPDAAYSFDPIELADHYIEENLTRSFTADELARAIGLSRRHLYRRFTEKHGLPLNEYIIRQRLSRAAAALIHTDKPVKEIAAMAGFRNLSYFTRQFRRIFILPPAAYRRNGG